MPSVDFLFDRLKISFFSAVSEKTKRIKKKIYTIVIVALLTILFSQDIDYLLLKIKFLIEDLF